VIHGSKRNAETATIEIQKSERNLLNILEIERRGINAPIDPSKISQIRAGVAKKPNRSGRKCMGMLNNFE